MITYWTAFGLAIALWFATGWYLNERLKFVHKKLDAVLESFDGLREYLYEIDPQFSDERQLLIEAFAEDGSPFAGKAHMDLMAEKNSEGFRTLRTNFLDGGHRAKNN